MTGLRRTALAWRAEHPGEATVLALLTTAFVLLCVAFSLLVPMFGNFDEQAHLDRARYTARHPRELVGPELRLTHGSWGALEAVRTGPEPRGSDGAAHRGGYRPFRDYPGGDAPDGAPCPGGLCQNIQYLHPPAWYLLAAPVTAVLEGQSFPRQVLALRWLNVALAVPLVPLAWATARQVWPRARRRALAVAAVVATAGPLAYTAAAVNNDGLLLLTMAVAMAAAARVLRRGPELGPTLLLGAAVGLGLVTKVQMVLAAPVFGLVVLAAPGAVRARVRGAVAFGVPAALGATWWLRQLVIDGSPLSPGSSELLRPPTPGPWTGAGYPGYALRRFPTLLDRLWGTYSDPITFVPGWLQGTLSGAAAALALVWLVRRPWRRPALGDLRWVLLALVPAALAAGTLYASLDAYRRTGELRGLAPRYVYPSTAILAIGLVAAVAALGRGWLRGGARRWALPVGTVALALGAGAGSVARSVHASYATTSWSDLATRASALGPVNHAGAVVAVVGLLWLAAVVAAAVGMGRLPDPDLAPGQDGVEPEPEPAPSGAPAADRP